MVTNKGECLTIENRQAGKRLANARRGRDRTSYVKCGPRGSDPEAWERNLNKHASEGVSERAPEFGRKSRKNGKGVFRRFQESKGGS